ncbi:hypothetical protein ES705_35835 [subsurface metagenome]
MLSRDNSLNRKEFNELFNVCHSAKKKIWLISLVALTIGLWSGLCFAGNYRPRTGYYKPGSEPDGFRGNKWGTDIKTLKGMEYIGTDPSYGGIKKYTKKNEDLRIGGAELGRIEYCFWRGKFCNISIIIKGSTNWTGLRDAVFEKFGEGYKSNEFVENYFWNGGITSMLLKYNEFSKEGKLFMGSEKINKQQKTYEKQKM